MAKTTDISSNFYIILSYLKKNKNSYIYFHWSKLAENLLNEIWTSYLQDKWFAVIGYCFLYFYSGQKFPFSKTYNNKN